MPKTEQVKKALELIRRGSANHEYFFSKLDSPDWIEPLQAEGVFSTPPSVVRDGDTISFPFWPESEYLARMASQDPEKVLAAMERIAETDNIRVHEDYTRAALAMPGPLAARWANRESSWIERQDHLYFMLPLELGKLSAHLARR